MSTSVLQGLSQCVPLDDIEQITANSFTHFHAQSMDYLCLHRSTHLTLKAYFFLDRDVSHPEVVCPHDHRYPFTTTVLRGVGGHKRYQRYGEGELFQEFEWRTPLNGGGGFSWLREERLWESSKEVYLAGQTYFCSADEIHTISIDRPDTIILLAQLGDTVPVDQPTSTFVPGYNDEPPKLDGLYEAMPEHYALRLMKTLSEIMK